MTDNTTIVRKAARRKLSLLELANDLGNASEACRPHRLLARTVLRDTQELP